MRKLPDLRATSIGPIAAEVLRHASELDLLAVFERSFYLMAPQGIVCIGLRDLGAGPINVLIEPLAGAQPWTGGLPAETKAITSAGRLTVGTAFTIDLATAAPWLPPPWPRVSTDAIARGVASALKLAPDMLPKDGLAPLVLLSGRPSPRTPTAEAASGLIADLRRVMPADLQRGAWSEDAVRSATLLVGLGPGLTPSGDDLLGGMMLALTALGRDHLRDALWDAISGELDDLTVPISAMHLSAAADGLGAEAMHETLGAVVAGNSDEIAHRLPALGAIGATSGWDALAGAMLVFAAIASDKK